VNKNWVKFEINIEIETNCVICHIPTKCGKRKKKKKSYKTLFKSLNPSAWSDGPCPHTEIVACRGVTGSARILHTAFKYPVEKPSHITV
jgi:hypothetical protein